MRWSALRSVDTSLTFGEAVRHLERIGWHFKDWRVIGVGKRHAIVFLHGEKGEPPPGKDW